MTRTEALTLGLKQYDMASPCKYGHTGTRFTNNKVCVECSRLACLSRSRANPEANRDRVKAWQKENPAKHAAKTTAHFRAKKYGISVGRLQLMELAQNNSCATCKEPFTQTAHVDHCHDTGRVRGLLCGPCNRALGMVKDNPETLQRMINYLKK